MDRAIDALERHVKFLDTLVFLESRAPKNLAGVGERFDAIVPMVQELRLERMLLPDSAPVYWSRPTAEAVAAVCSGFDLAAIRCDRELLYCDRACCWFEHPVIVLVDQDSTTIPIQALSWWFVEFREDDGGPMRQGLGITAWANHVDDSYLTPAVWARVYAQDPLANAVTYEQDGYRNCATACIQFVIAAGAFMRQKLAIVEPARAYRQARKRLVAAGWTRDAAIDVIHLREREGASRAPSDEPVSREFHWRWIVRSHVRQQWFPSLSKHLPVLVSPHIKGPEDKPFKPRTLPLVVVDR